MKLIVISSPGPVTNEAAIIRSLFEGGLQLFHLRKPDYAPEETAKLLDAIGPQYRDRISIRNHHQYAEKWGISRLHIPESLRAKTTDKQLAALAQQKTISTSLHSFREAWTLPDSYSYVLLGPVFDSISKPGYEGKNFTLAVERPATKNPNLEFFALGGVDETNIHMAAERGFDGAALLGTIWRASDPAKQFQKILSLAESYTPLRAAQH